MSLLKKILKHFSLYTVVHLSILCYNVSMTLNIIKRKSDGRTFLAYYDGKRENGKVKKYMVEKIGFLDELEKEHPDPIAFYKEEARRLTAEKRRKEKEEAEARKSHFQFKTRYDKRKVENELESEDKIISYGAIALSYFYHELELNEFLDNRRRYTDAEYNHNSIFKLLVFGRILMPSSKLKTWRNRAKFIEKADFSDDDVYNSLSFFAKYKEDMISAINKKLEKLGYRDNSSIHFYDVTNYYWEIDENDEDKILDNGEFIEGMRKKGHSKEHRPAPIIQMGLMMDKSGFPIDYGLFPGNCNDVLTFVPMMCRDKGKHVIYIADKAMMSGNNIASLILHKCGYIISKSVRSCDKELEEFVLDKEGYVCSYDKNNNEVGKIKERTYPVTLNVKGLDGKKRDVSVNVRQVVLFSEKYKHRAKKERDEAIQKALKDAEKSKKHGALNTYGANKYLKKTIFDADEEVERPEFKIEIDWDKIKEEEKLDGYYVLFTNVYGSDEKKTRFDSETSSLILNQAVTASEIASWYKELWRIEDNFRVTKSFLKTRPVYVRQKESIEAHFLSCYVALVISRMIEKKTERKIEMNVIIEELRKANLYIAEDDEKFYSTYCSNALWLIAEKTGLDLTRRVYSKKDLRELVAQSKKH